MKLGLSSAAAPAAHFDDLIATCARRGLAALELCAGDGHGIRAPDGPDAGDAARRAHQAGIAVTAMRSMSPDHDEDAAIAAKAMGAAILVDGASPVESKLSRAARLADTGAEVAIALSHAAPRAELGAIMNAGLPLAWTIDPASGDAGTIAKRVLDAAGDRLEHVQLMGGGPESAMHEGAGIGEAMSVLAMSSYNGTFVIRPSSSRYRIAWERWLDLRGGWGCGSKPDAASHIMIRGEG